MLACLMMWASTLYFEMHTHTHTHASTTEGEKKMVMMLLMIDRRITQGGTARGGGLRCRLKNTERAAWDFRKRTESAARQSLYCWRMGYSTSTPTHKWHINSVNTPTLKGPELPCEFTSLHRLPKDYYNIKTTNRNLPVGSIRPVFFPLEATFCLMSCFSMLISQS